MKKLLEEGQIRKIMGLAKLQPLANSFISRLQERCECDKSVDESKDEEALDEKCDAGAKKDRNPLDEMMGGDVENEIAGDPEMAEPAIGDDDGIEPDVEMDGPVDAEQLAASLAKRVMDAIAAAITDETGQDIEMDVSIDSDDSMTSEPVADMEPPMGLEDEMGMEDEEDEEEPFPPTPTLAESKRSKNIEEKIVNELLRRVGARLIKN